PASGDEIGDLGRSFEAAVSRLKGYQDYLEQLARRLSHELRTPIATITGAMSILRNHFATTAEATRQALLDDVSDAASRLNHLVANLLDMSRLDAGWLQLKLDWCMVGDVVGVAVQRMQGR
ncbi:MAG: hypothetical protein KDE58_32805, partial [Caldilineaceae bacterium]|nr:hypothetical protein [Caldilineaceae bacterium]